jgi:DeoR family transcriptional regulator, aga operon transcriptional repressor
MSSAAERRDVTLKLLRAQGHVSVADLSERFDVSEVTIRNDLNQLARHNLLVRTHGGALLSENFVHERSLDDKSNRRAEEKQRIGRLAASLVSDGDSLILDSGTTTLQVARHLRGKRDITVITNSLLVAQEMLKNAGAEVLILGGSVRSGAATAVGPFAEAELRGYACQRLFLGVDGFHLDYGLTTTDPFEAHLNKLMMQVSEKTIVVADSSKFGLRGFGRINAISYVDTLVTDDQIPREIVSRLENIGIEVLIA